MKLTPWFPGTVKPVRKGVYQQKNGVGSLGYQYWDGKFWHGWSSTVYGAQRDNHIAAEYYQNDPWRGVAK